MIKMFVLPIITYLKICNYKFGKFREGFIIREVSRNFTDNKTLAKWRITDIGKLCPIVANDFMSFLTLFEILAKKTEFTGSAVAQW